MYINANNQNVYYQKLGSGKDLVLLHGWGHDVSTWWGVVDKLKDNFTVWLVDLPGFGRSDLPNKPFKVEDYAKVVEEFIKLQKLKKPHLLGHSHGGRTAIVLTANNPELIDKLILEDSAGIKPKRNNLKSIFYVGAKIVKYLVPNIFNLKQKMRAKFYQSIESDYLSAGDLTETLKLVLEEDLTPQIGKIRNQTLLIWGEKDPTNEASLKNGLKMYKLIKNSRIKVLDDVGHSPHLEAPEKFIYWVGEFLK